MRSIIWDWNGTLLDDIDFCISTINILLQKRKLPLLTHDTYKEVFSFPVMDYYASIGFDFQKEDFSIPAQEYMDLYNAGVNNCKLHNSVFEILTGFQKKGIKQFVLSAMKQDMLEETLKHHHIYDIFEDVAGLDDHYANSKIERGSQLFKKHQIEKCNSWMIGDTIHDFEVAEYLGINCILISDGHQSEERLKKSGAIVVNKLMQLSELKNPKSLQT